MAVPPRSARKAAFGTVPATVQGGRAVFAQPASEPRTDDDGNQYVILPENYIQEDGYGKQNVLVRFPQFYSVPTIPADYIIGTACTDGVAVNWYPIGENRVHISTFGYHARPDLPIVYLQFYIHPVPSDDMYIVAPEDRLLAVFPINPGSIFSFDVPLQSDPGEYMMLRTSFVPYEFYCPPGPARAPFAAVDPGEPVLVFSTSNRVRQ